MAFQDFAQKHSKSDMRFLTLYCLIESFGSACSAVSCKLYLCVWVIFSGGGFVLLPQVTFFIFWKKKKDFFFSVLFNVPKFLYCLSCFFASTFAGGFNFFVVWCFCLVFLFFGHAASPEACRELSDLSGSCSAGRLSREQQGGWTCGDESVHGLVSQCLLYFSEFWQHCKACCLFQTSFWPQYS